MRLPVSFRSRASSCPVLQFQRFGPAPDPNRAPTVFSLALRFGDAASHALDNHVALQLRERGEDAHEESAGRILRVGVDALVRPMKRPPD